MKEIILLGASGSIGKQTVEVVTSYPDKYKIVAIAVNKNMDVAFELVQQFNIEHVCIFDENMARKMRNKLSSVGNKWTNVVEGMDGLLEMTRVDGDVVVNALVGSVGILPTIEALKHNKDVALANKETLVAAGDIVMDYAAKSEGQLIPVDSEHSAIFQCLESNYHETLNQLIITASGGSLRDLSLEELDGVTKAQVLAHPNWSMGDKITVDSATLMNKGFEVIEAKHLFQLPYEQIHTVMHRQSMVHSMAEYVDGSILGHLGVTDMRIPIQYALTYPTREKLFPTTAFDWSKSFSLTFEPISMERFPALAMAYECGRVGGTKPAVLNAANEIAVATFLNGQLPFVKITDVLRYTIDHIEVIEEPTLADILTKDKEARELARLYISTL